METKAALKLIRENGVGGLGGYDGCLCTHFSIQGFQIDVSCRKSNGGTDRIAPDFYGIKLRVWRRSLDGGGADLRLIADEVAAQLRPEGYGIMARFCDYRHDAEMLCTYCDKPRSDPTGYLCDACMVRTDHCNVAEEYDYRKYDFTLPPHPSGSA